MSSMKWILFGGALALSTLGAVEFVEEDATPTYVYVDQEPPNDVVEEVTAAPSAAHVWTKGHWRWDGHWVWVKGRWINRPHESAVWVSGYWKHRHHHHWVWVPGHWE